MSATVLLADDSPAIHRVVELTLAGQGIDVVSVADGEQAIARIQDLRPDVVLADIGMPKRSGYDVAAFVKQHPDLARIPVLLLAGAFEPVDEARVAQIGCEGVLVKPFEPQHLLTRVRQLVLTASEGPAAGTPAQSPAWPGGQPDTPAPEPFDALSSALIEALPGFDAWDRADQGTGEPSEATGAKAERLLPEPLEISRFERVDTPVSTPEPPSTDAALEDYFDRLDAAFATLGNTTAEPAAPEPPAPPDPPSGGGAWIDQPVPTIAELLASMPSSSVPAPADPFDRVSAPPIEPPDMTPTLSPAPARPDAGRDEPPAGLADGDHFGSRRGPTDAAAGGPRSGEAPAPAARAATAAAGDRNAIVDVFHLLFAVEQGELDPARVRVGPPSGGGTAAASDDLVDEVTRRVLERLAPDAVRDVVADIVADVAERLVRQEIDRIRNAR